MAITEATIADVPELTILINSAYRGETSLKGWTTEANLIDGQRIDAASLAEQIFDPTAVVLKNTSDEGRITACVYLQKRQEKLYLGMLTVSPMLQANGLGKLLLAAAENRARDIGCTIITMTVITSRDELINYYERRGYRKTGKVIPLLIPEKFGVLKQPLDLFILEKSI